MSRFTLKQISELTVTVLATWFWKHTQKELDIIAAASSCILMRAQTNSRTNRWTLRWSLFARREGKNVNIVLRFPITRNIFKHISMKLIKLSLTVPDSLYMKKDDKMRWS